MQMEKEFCHQRGWQRRALQLRGQLFQRGGVDEQVNVVETSKGGGDPAIAHSSVQFRTLSCAPPTPFSWVSE